VREWLVLLRSGNRGRAIHLTDPAVPLDIVLHTLGGLVLASLQIARAIHLHPGKVTAFVPHYAMSGRWSPWPPTRSWWASMQCSVPSILNSVSSPPLSILKAVAKKPVAEVDDQTLILADQAEKAIAQLRESVAELLSDKLPAEKGEQLSRLLSEGTWTHDHPITFDKAKVVWVFPSSRRCRPSLSSWWRSILNRFGVSRRSNTCPSLAGSGMPGIAGVAGHVVDARGRRRSSTAPKESLDFGRTIGERTRAFFGLPIETGEPAAVLA
jgi:Serine dehydrogenase proteinase